MDRDVRYCTTDDGVRIAYCIEGSGPDLVCCPDFIGSFSLDALIEDQMGFWRGLWRGRRVIRFDMRGTGLSQRDVGDITHDAVCRDLAAVVRASDARRFTLYASTLAGPRAIAYAAAHPRQVRRLVLHRTFARASDIMTREQAQNFAQLARLNWPTAAQTFADMPVRRELPDAGVHQAQVYVQSTDGELVAQILTTGFDSTDVTPLLPRVRVPTLILHRRDDPMFSFRLAQQLAATIPNARLVPLRKGIMSYLADGEIGDVLEIINDFIGDGAVVSARDPQRGDKPAASQPGTAIILFTDIADSAALTERMGDEAFHSAARHLDERIRAAIRDANGTPVDGMLLGDGVLATFTSAREALNAARAFLDLSSESELRLHIGIHAGDVIRESNNVFGGAVNIAARICGLCEPEEILVSQTVRDLARTSAGVAFEDRGERALKGIEDPVRVFAVRAN